MIGVHQPGLHLVELLVFAVPCFFGWLIPIVLGFAYVLPDANRRGQPGVLWAFATIPPSWLANLALLVARALAPPQSVP